MSDTKINLIWILILVLIAGFSIYTLSNANHDMMMMEGDGMMNMDMSGDHMEGMEKKMESTDNMPMEGVEGDMPMEGMDHNEMMGAPEESM